jgi:TolB-like protein/Tfp pilus assembly protein PilF
VTEPVPGIEPPERSPAKRLDSWKEIAAYLHRDVTTVQRWEKLEGMPVYRHVHDKRGSVYAVPAELDAWRQSRKPPEKDVGPAAETPAAQTPLLIPMPSVDESQMGRRAKPRTLHWLIAAGAAVLVLSTIGFFVARNRREKPLRPKISSLAVLPLKNLSGDPSQEYLADGMTDALIGRLAGIRELRVISYTSVMRFKNPQLSVPEIAKTLNVDAIVEGSMMRQGKRVRVTAQLIRGATDEHFWSETYDRKLQDVLTLQSELAESIASKVEVSLTGEEHQRLAATRTVAPEVYESYLQGAYELNKSPTRADIEQGIADFNDAINRDPTFAPAYAGLAEAYSELGSNFIGQPPDAEHQKAISAVRKALELEPTLAQAHALLASMLTEQWQWANGEAEYKAALELNPNDAAAYEGYAWWLLYQGRADEGVEWGRRGRELDPFMVEGPDFAMMLSTARRYDEAIHELRTVLAAQPDDPVALWDLGIVLTEDNQPKEAIPVLEKAVAASNRSAVVIGNLIRAYASAGRRGDAIRLLSELQTRRKAGFVPARAFVDAYVGLGDDDQAFAWLEQGYKDRSNIMQRLKASPDFDPLRADPRFAKLVRRVGLS